MCGSRSTAVGFEQMQQTRHLEQTKCPTLKPLQAESVLTITRNLESFDESRKARDVNVGKVGHIEDDGCRRLLSQQGQKLIAEVRRRVNTKASAQMHKRSVFAFIHGDLQISRAEYAGRQPISSLVAVASWIAQYGYGSIRGIFANCSSIITPSLQSI